MSRLTREERRLLHNFEDIEIEDLEEFADILRDSLIGSYGYIVDFPRPGMAMLQIIKEVTGNFFMYRNDGNASDASIEMGISNSLFLNDYLRQKATAWKVKARNDGYQKPVIRGGNDN